MRSAGHTQRISPNAQVPKRKKSRLTLYIGIAIVAAVGLDALRLAQSRRPI